MNKTHKSIVFSMETEFLEPVPLKENPMLSKVKIKIGKAGHNRNGVYISKEVLDEAARTSLALTPIVAYFNPYVGDFADHDVQPIKDSLGEMIGVTDTNPIGVIPDNPEIFWEDGHLCTYGYLWTSRYPEVVIALAGKGQSMELSEEFTILKKRSDGYIELLETKFEGLCILGDSIAPCFEEASIKGLNYSLINKDLDTEEKVNEGVGEFMSKLKFALDSEIEDDLIIDKAGRKEKDEYKTLVTKTIDSLDEVAELEDPENQAKLDDVITELVGLEAELVGEPNIIANSQKARDALKGTPTSEDGLVSVNTTEYKAKASNSLIKKNLPKSEEEDLTLESKDKKRKEEEELEGTKVPQKEEVVENGAPEGTPETTEAEVKVEEEAAQETEIAKPVVAEGTEVPTDVQPTPVVDNLEEESQEQRVNANTKRKTIELADTSTEDLFAVLAERIGDAEMIRTQLGDLFSNELETAEPTSLEGPVEAEAAPAPIEAYAPGDVVEVELPPQSVAAPELPESEGQEAVQTDNVVPVEGEAVSEEVPAETEAPTETEAPVVEEEKAEVEVESTDEEVPEETDEEKKKKRYSLDTKEIIEENILFEKRIVELTKENKELLEFKLNSEKDDKEKVLSGFDITDTSKEDIRLSFSTLSVEEVEDRAAIALYKERKSTFGQKLSKQDIVFSRHNETESISVPTDLEMLLERSRDELSKQ